MATKQNDILRVLSTKDAPVSAADIAPEVKTTKESVTTNLGRMRMKGLVEGGGTEWMITDNGRAEVVAGTVTITDVGRDELSEFKRYGQLSPVEQELITAAAELFQEGDVRSLEVQLPDLPPVQHSRAGPGQVYLIPAPVPAGNIGRGGYCRGGRLSVEELNKAMNRVT